MSCLSWIPAFRGRHRWGGMSIETPYLLYILGAIFTIIGQFFKDDLFRLEKVAEVVSRT